MQILGTFPLHLLPTFICFLIKADCDQRKVAFVLKCISGDNANTRCIPSTPTTPTFECFMIKAHCDQRKVVFVLKCISGDNANSRCIPSTPNSLLLYVL